MYLGFKKDFFLKSKISWSSKINKKKYNSINHIIKTYVTSLNCNIKQNKGLELNSNNFKIKFKSNSFILKKWRKKMKINEIKFILDLMIWLKKKRIPVQNLRYFNNGKYLVKYKNEFWSLFDFVEGNHFSGNINELKNVAKDIGKLSNELKQYPIKKFSKNLKYFLFEDYKILKKMMQKNFDFKKKFGQANGKYIKTYLPHIISLFRKFKKIKLNNQNKKIVHNDLHPHNIILKNNNVQAFLDLGSCKVVRGDYYIAYSALKLSKQTVLKSRKKDKKKKIIKHFLKSLNQNYSLNKDFKKNLYYYAVSEVLRRLIYIFKLSINNNDKKWNKIITIQLGHLEECKEFFLE